MNCVCDLDVVVGLFYILAINMGVFVQKIFICQDISGNLLEKEETAEENYSGDFYTFKKYEDHPAVQRFV